jgi:hypothetical protein
MQFTIGMEVRIISGGHNGKIGTIEKIWPAGIVTDCIIYTVRIDSSRSGMYKASEIEIS